MFDSGRSADEIVTAKGWRRSATKARSGDRRSTCLPATPTRWTQYRAGKTQTFGFLVGQVMKGSGGKANPKLANQLVKRELEQA